MFVIVSLLLFAPSQPSLYHIDDVCASLALAPSWLFKQQSKEKCWKKTNTSNSKNQALCDAGSHLVSDRMNAHQQINYLRRLAGLAPVDLSEITSRQSSLVAQTASRNGFTSILQMSKASSNEGQQNELVCNTGYDLTNTIMTTTKNSCSLNSISHFFLNVQNRHFLLNPKLSSIGIGQYKDVTVIAQTDLLPSSKESDVEFNAFPGNSNIYPKYLIDDIDWSFELMNEKLNNMVRVSVICDKKKVKISYKRINNHIVSFSIGEPLKAGKKYDVTIHDRKDYNYSVTVTECPYKLSKLFSVVAEDPPSGVEPPQDQQEFNEYCIANRILECSFGYQNFEANNVAITFEKAAEILASTQKTGITFYIGMTGNLVTSMENFVNKRVSVIADTNVVAELTLNGDFVKATENNQTLKYVKLNIAGKSNITFNEFNITVSNSNSAISTETFFEARKLNTDFLSLYYLSQHYNPFVKVTNISVDGGEDLTDVKFRAGSKVTLSNKGNSLNPGYVEEIAELPSVTYFYAVINRHLNFIIDENVAITIPETIIFLTNNYPDVFFDGSWTTANVGTRLTFQLYNDRKLETSGNFIPQYKLIYVPKENDYWFDSNARNETIVEKVGISLASCVAVSLAFTCLVCAALGHKNKYSKLEHDEEDGNENRHISDSFDEHGDEQL